MNILFRACRAALPVVAFGCAVANPCSAQIIVLKNGQNVTATDLKVDAQGNLHTTVKVGNTVGDQAYRPTEVDRIVIPKPAQIGQAEQALLTGKAAEAVAIIDLVIKAYEPFRKTKGNYWAESVLIKSAALQAQNKVDQALVQLEPLKGYDLDASVALTAKARLAGLLAYNKTRATEASALADEILKTNTDDQSALGETWLAKGRALYTLQKYEDALLAFLHLPVFYYDSPTSTAQAMLMSGRCYLELEDNEKAVRAFMEVQEQFSTTPEAIEAKREIEKGGSKMAQIVKKLEDKKAEEERKLKESQSNSPAA